MPGTGGRWKSGLVRLADGHRLVICYEAGPTGFSYIDGCNKRVTSRKSLPPR
ncbi:MAG: hypothetical protein R3C02_10825 [Planctomycetaceae bacterium]